MKSGLIVPAERMGAGQDSLSRKNTTIWRCEMYINRLLNGKNKDWANSYAGILLEKNWPLLRTVQPSSADAKRAFSAAGLYFTKIHCRLSNESLDMLANIRARLMAQARAMGQSLRDPWSSLQSGYSANSCWMWYHLWLGIVSILKNYLIFYRCLILY